MSGRTFALLMLAAMFSLVVAVRIENEWMKVFSFALLLLPPVAVAAQNEVK